MKWTRTALVLGLAAGLLTALALYRPVLGLFYELHGSAALHSAIQEGGADPSELACLAPPIRSEEAKLLLQQAVGKLEISAQIWPAAHPQLLLGRAFCYTGQTGDAVEAFSAYVQARPRNPIGQLELALAFGAACKTDQQQPASIPEICQDAQVRQAVLQAWRNSGQDPAQFINVARSAFTAGKIVESERYFMYHSSYDLDDGGLSEGDLFLWTASAVLAKKTPPLQAMNVIPVFQALRLTRVEGEQLRWISYIPEWNVNYGETPQVVTIQDQKAGLVPWNGAVVAIIHVELPGEYRISLQAWDAPPAPILVQVELDGESLGQVTLDQGNSTWAVHSILTEISGGFHIVGVRLMNDELVDGVDRNLFINWIEIEYVGN